MQLKSQKTCAGAGSAAHRNRMDERRFGKGSGHSGKHVW